MSQPVQVDVFRDATMAVCVYSVQCKCGVDLDFSAEVDADQDLLIQVSPHVCEQESTT